MFMRTTALTLRGTNNNTTMHAWLPKRSPIHGWGLFARQHISPGDLILSETPLLERVASVKNAAKLSAVYDKMFNDAGELNQEDLAKLRILVQKHTASLKGMATDQFADRFRNLDLEMGMAVWNGFLASSYPFCPDHKAVVHRLFRDLSLVNHSCNPNAEVAWHSEAKRILVHATKAIAKEDEIFISYCDHFNVRDERHHALEFQCRCRVCALTGEDELAYETGLTMMAQSLKTVEAFKSQYFPDYDNEMEKASEALIHAMSHNGNLQDVHDAANRIHAIVVKHEMHHSRIAVA